MTEIHETELPGIGVRQEFDTAGGSRLGVLTTRTGRRELLLYDREDPDAVRSVVHLDPEDSIVLADLLGATHVADPTASLQQLDGLAIDWLTVNASSPVAGLTARRRLGGDRVGVHRARRRHPGPGAAGTPRRTSRHQRDPLLPGGRTARGCRRHHPGRGDRRLHPPRRRDRRAPAAVHARPRVHAQGAVDRTAPQRVPRAGRRGRQLHARTARGPPARLGPRGSGAARWRDLHLVVGSDLEAARRARTIRQRETAVVLSVLVLEDLAMAVYLPVVGVLLSGAALLSGAVSVGLALLVVTVILTAAVRFGPMVSRRLETGSDEVVLLTVLGLVLLVGGLAQQLQVSAAVGAFFVGLAVSGPAQHRAGELTTPLRDLFAAIFFFVFGLGIDASTLPPVVLPALVLAVVSAATKFALGWWAAGRNGIGAHGRWRTGTMLVPRGEFSIVIAGLGVVAGIEADLGPFAAAYVLILAALGPLLARGDRVPVVLRRWLGPVPPAVPLERQVTDG